MESKQEKHQSGAKEFFVHLLTFGLLYVFSISFIGLWWQYINIKFPDPLNYYATYGFDQLRWPIAVLVVVFPVYILLARMTTREIAADPSKKDSRVYRWLIYLTLFVSAVTVIIDLITLIYNFLGGELTARFGLKVLVVLVVALGIFGYYFWHLKSDVSQTIKTRRVFLWSSIMIVIASIIFAFVIVGSPATARAQKFDQQRVNDLQTIQAYVENYWRLNQKLPTTIDEARMPIDYYLTLLDPETKQPYEYSVKSELTFQLCAKFESYHSGKSMNGNYWGPNNNNFWGHDAGRFCYNRIIDPELYPKPLKQ